MLTYTSSILSEETIDIFSACVNAQGMKAKKQFCTECIVRAVKGKLYVSWR